MAITLQCPSGHIYNVTEDLAGATATCPSCGTSQAVPDVPMASPVTLPTVAPGANVTPTLVEALRQHWPRLKINLCTVRIQPGVDVLEAQERLIEAVRGPLGPPDPDVVIVRGLSRGREGQPGLPFVGLIGRHEQQATLQWFCENLYDLQPTKEHNVLLTLDHPMDDLLRPDAGAVNVTVMEYHWGIAQSARPKPAAPADDSGGRIKSMLDVQERLPTAPTTSAGMNLEPLKAPLPSAGHDGHGQAHTPVRSRAKEAEAQHRADEETQHLGNVRAAKSAPELMPALQSPNPNMRMAAVERLGSLGDNSAVGLLVLALRDDNPTVRRKAVDALGEYADPRAVEPLAARLDDEDEDLKVRESAIWALVRIRHPSAIKRVAPVLVRWAGENSFHTSQAIKALERLKDPWVANLLVRQLPEDCESAESGTLRAIRAIGAPHIVAPLVAAIKDKNYLVRSLAAELLGEARDPRALDPLMDLLMDEDKHLRKAAIEALGNIGDPRAGPAFQEALQDKSKAVRKAAAEALQAMGITWY